MKEENEGGERRGRTKETNEGEDCTSEVGVGVGVWCEIRFHSAKFRSGWQGRGQSGGSIELLTKPFCLRWKTKYKA